MPKDPKSGQEPTIIRTSRVENYVSLEESLQYTWSDKELRKLRRQTPQLSFMIHSKYLICMIYFLDALLMTCVFFPLVWMKFQKQHGRKLTEDDLASLLENKTQLLAEMGVNDPSKLDDELIR